MTATLHPHPTLIADLLAEAHRILSDPKSTDAQAREACGWLIDFGSPSEHYKGTMNLIAINKIEEYRAKCREQWRHIATPFIFAALIAGIAVGYLTVAEPIARFVAWQIEASE